MGSEENVAETGNEEDSACKAWTLCKHTFNNLAHVSPVVFLFLVKQCYFYGMISFSCNANNYFPCQFLSFLEK